MNKLDPRKTALLIVNMTNDLLGWEGVRPLVPRLQRLLNQDKGSGMSLIQDLERENIAGVPNPIAFTPETDKVTRMHAQSAKIEAGHVHLPRRAEWLEDFRTELLQFPKGRHDDQVDSLSQFLNWLEQRNRNRWWVEPLEL